jgi:mono/diheme cytochrome c family protein
VIGEDPPVPARPLALALILSCAARGLTADRPRMEPKALYAQACAACHGADGKGAATWQGEVPVPDFSDCLANTAEPAELWETIVAQGGSSRGLSATMPAYGEALDPAEIRGLVTYLRTFCENFEKYPPGDLNFRRPLDTGKAYPEQEIVVKPEYERLGGSGGAGMEVSYENRLGARFQYEATLPFVFSQPGAGSGGIGDLELEAKQVLAFSGRTMQILSAGIGLTLPTGDFEKGLGDGATVFEPFVAYGKAWGRTVLQTRLKGEISANAARRDSELVFQLALSQALGPPRIAWVPAVEFLGSRNLVTGENEWASVLEVSKPLSALGHVIGALGVRLPITESDEKYRIEAYLLWDFGDGPFWKGW